MKKIFTLLLATVALNLAAQTHFYEVKKFEGSSNDVAIKAYVKNGNYLYVASYFSNSCLKTYNIQNPELAYLTDSINYASSDRNIYDLSIDNGILYAIGEDGLTVYSLVDPAHPAQTAFITQVMDGGTARALDSWSGVRSGNTYLCESGWTGLMAINLSNIGSPLFCDYVSYSGVMNDIKLINSTTALFCDGYNAYKLNFADPYNLSKTTITITGDPNGICYNQAKNVAYITSTSSSGSWTRLYVLDMNSNLIIDSVELTSYDIDCKDMSLKNNDTLLLGMDNGLAVLKVTDNMNISVVEYFNTPYYGGSNDAILSLDANYFVASSYSDILFYKWGQAPGGIKRNPIDAVSVFPNPASTMIEISTPERSDIEIFNIEGALVNSVSAAGNNTIIDVSGFSNGIYFVKIKTETGISVKKFVKED